MAGSWSAKKDRASGAHMLASSAAVSAYQSEPAGVSAPLP
jgi:hypothetical protein